MPFTVGHNMPGYMPESEPFTFPDWDSAKRSLIVDMLSDADAYDMSAEFADDADENHTLAEELSSECEDLNLSNGPEYGATIGNVHYWITETAWSDVDFSSDEYGNAEELALAYLTQDTGRVPCSRYGSDSEECAAIAWRAECIIADAGSDPITTKSLDATMGRVVNDSDDIAYLLGEYGTDEERETWGRSDITD